MKKTLIGSVSFLLVLIIAGIIFWQNNVTRPYKLLLHADTLILDRPDSALHVLQSIDNPQSLHGENKALYALLMTQAQYKNHLPVKNDSLIRIAVDYYANGNDSLRKAWSYLYMAQVCRDMNDKKLSLDYYQKAGIAAKGSNNYKLLDLLYYYWGKLLQAEKPYEEGLDKLMKAKKYGEINKDTLSIIYSLKEIGWSYNWMEDYKQAKDYLSKAIHLAYPKYTNLLPKLYQSLSTICQQDKQFTKALEYINKALENTDPNSQNYKIRLFIKGSIFNDLHQHDSAYYYLNKGQENDDFYSIASYQHEMFQLEENLGNYQEAFKWSRLYSSYKDSIEIKKKDNNLIELQKKYDYTLIQNENIQLKNISQRKSITSLSIVIVLLLILFATYYIYNRANKKKEKIIQIKNRQLEENGNQLQQKTNELLQNRQTIQEKETELKKYMVKEQELRKNISMQGQTLDFYMQQQQNLKEQIFRMNKIVIRIEETCKLDTILKDKQSNKIKLSKEELDELISAINLCYNNFEERLSTKYPILDNIDRYICCLLKMDVKPQDISYLLGISDDTLKQRKYRIKKQKMKIIQKDISLTNILKNY